MKVQNEMRLELLAISENESFARVCVGAFAAQLNPTLEELADVKTAVSEAVTNAIIHGYETQTGMLYIHVSIALGTLYIEVMDKGRGIQDIEMARQPFYTTKPELERSGMGFTVMEAFMDEVEITSELGSFTKVYMTKRFHANDIEAKEA